jgi:hypothetical protein
MVFPMLENQRFSPEYPLPDQRSETIPSPRLFPT